MRDKDTRLSYNFNKDDCKNIASTVVIKEVVNSNELPLVVDLEYKKRI